MRPYGTDNAAFCREIAAYNYRHSRARRTVECAFGILVSKWGCLKTELQVLPEHVDRLVLTACLLHNLIIDKDGIDKATVQKITTSNTAEGGASIIRGPRRYNRATREAYNICERFKVYFNGEGAVDFQYNQIDTCAEWWYRISLFVIEILHRSAYIILHLRIINNVKYSITYLLHGAESFLRS